jgi:hypothetical protein
MQASRSGFYVPILHKRRKERWRWLRLIGDRITGPLEQLFLLMFEG